MRASAEDHKEKVVAEVVTRKMGDNQDVAGKRNPVLAFDMALDRRT